MLEKITEDCAQNDKSQQNLTKNYLQLLTYQLQTLIQCLEDYVLIK